MAFAGTAGVWSSADSLARVSGSTQQYTQVPRRFEPTSPASLSTFRWWEIVGWETSNGSMSSHTHASPPSCEAISDSSAAVFSPSGSRTICAQHAVPWPSTGRPVCFDMAQAIAEVTSLLAPGVSKR